MAEMKAVGRPVDEEDAKLKLLNSLPPSYKPLVYSICDKSFQECWNALLQDQISREFEKSSVEAESQLLYSTQRQSKGGGNSRRSSGYTPEKLLTPKTRFSWLLRLEVLTKIILGWWILVLQTTWPVRESIFTLMSHCTLPSLSTWETILSIP
ncbi:hypothetical protein R1flu_026725 [Riccia fluitans]|uniref:Uncharacterized protein n=1 Tax=Riccia fluitans TaxID=41844 RepID=A0ABD1XGR8_9MARC